MKGRSFLITLVSFGLLWIVNPMFNQSIKANGRSQSETIYSAESSNPQKPFEEISVSEQVNLNEITKTLQEITPIMAATIFENYDFSSTIFSEANRKVTGDYEALFSRVVERLAVQNKAKNLFQLLNQRYASGASGNVIQNSSKSFTDLIASIPDFNFLVYVPKESSRESIDLSETVITANRYDIDDLKDFDVIGYNNMGQPVILNSQKKPDFPVIVLGMSERIDFLPNKRFDIPNEGSDMSRNYGMAAAGGLVYLREILLEKTLEGWLSGDPEVYGFYFSLQTNNSIVPSHEYANVNSTWYPYPFNENISIANYQECFIVLLVEHDPGSHSLTNLPFWCGSTQFTCSYLNNAGADDPYGFTGVLTTYPENEQFDLGAARLRFGH